MSHNIAGANLNEPALSPIDKTLLVFTSFNVCPNRITLLGTQAQEQGLDLHR